MLAPCWRGDVGYYRTVLLGMLRKARIRRSRRLSAILSVLGVLSVTGICPFRSAFVSDYDLNLPKEAKERCRRKLIAYSAAKTARNVRD